VAYPKLTDVPAMILSEDLRRQIVAAVPEAGEAEVVIAGPIGAGRVELFMTRESCRALMWLEGVSQSAVEQPDAADGAGEMERRR
jgi:hypothetical protein